MWHTPRRRRQPPVFQTTVEDTVEIAVEIAFGGGQEVAGAGVGVRCAQLLPTGKMLLELGRERERPVAVSTADLGHPPEGRAPPVRCRRSIVGYCPIERSACFTDRDGARWLQIQLPEVELVHPLRVEEIQR